MDFPRVLVVASIKFNQQAGGGVTMGNLFRGWPHDAIAQIHTDLFTKADESVCTNYLYLPESPIRWPSFRPRAIASLTKQVLMFAIGRRVTLGPWVRMENLLKWSRQFAPDVIYARPNDNPTFYWWLTRKLAQSLGIPYVTHIMDDWPARYEDRQGLINYLFWKPALRQILQSLFDGAAINIGISEEMCQAYGKRYGCQFVPFHNCIDVSEWSIVEKSYHTGGEFRIVYLGVVTEDKELGSLIDIRDTVVSIRGQGYPVSLLIYSARQWKDTIQRHLVHSPFVVYGGYVCPVDLPEVLSRANLLVLPINFDRESLTYVGYSLQTKVPEYMASGTPVLVYGPPTSPNVRYAMREGWGLVVDQHDKARLEKAIMKLMEDSDLQARLGKRARELAFRNHNAAVVRKQFLQLMSDVTCGVYQPLSVGNVKQNEQC